MSRENQSFKRSMNGRAGLISTGQPVEYPARRMVRRHDPGKPLAETGSLHLVQVWTQVPHPRYGKLRPHFVPSLLPCVSDHSFTKECYVRRGLRRRRG